MHKTTKLIGALGVAGFVAAGSASKRNQHRRRLSDGRRFFRKLSGTGSIRCAYRGEHGTVSVVAELPTPTGWHATVAIQPRVPFADFGHTGTVVLDLDRVRRRAHAAAGAIGIPATQIDSIDTLIVHDDGITYRYPTGDPNPTEPDLGHASVTMSSAAPAAPVGPPAGTRS